MSRPETVDDVTDRTVRLAVFDFERFATTPDLLIAHGQFMAAAERIGGTNELQHGTVTVYRPKTDTELADELDKEQRMWDGAQKDYERLIAGEEFRYEFQRAAAITHARREGLPLPAAAAAQ